MLLHLGSPEDWPLWRAVRVAALADAPEAFPGASAEWTDGGEARWRDQLLDPSVLTIVAVQDGAPVGLVRGLVDEKGSAWLHSLWVSPRLRGHGLGDRLMAAVEEWARPRAGRLRLEVVPTNSAAIGLYRRHGYHVTDAQGDSLPGGGHELVLEKHLGSPREQGLDVGED